MTQRMTTAPVYDTDRLIDAYLPAPTGADLDAENALLAAIRLHRRQVAEACTGRKTRCTSAPPTSSGVGTVADLDLDAIKDRADSCESTMGDVLDMTTAEQTARAALLPDSPDLPADHDCGYEFRPGLGYLANDPDCQTCCDLATAAWTRGAA